MKFIHAADIHLDSPMLGLARYDGAPEAELRGATRRAFVRLVDYACAEGLDAVLIAGDLYDGNWRDYNTGLFFCSQLARLREAGIEVVICSGNHDAESVLTRQLRLPADVTLLRTKKPYSAELAGGALVVHGQGYAKRDLRDNIARGYPTAVPGALNVGLLHTALDGRDGHDTYAPCTLQDLLALEYDYFGLGHVHGREVVSEWPPVVFPGNLQGRNWRESGSKGATVVSAEEGLIVSVEHESFDVVRWIELELDATGASDGDDLLVRAEPALERVVDDAEGRLVALRVRVTGTTPLHAALVNEIERFQADMRALAIEVAAEQLWLGQIRTGTAPPAVLARDARHPLSDLLDDVAGDDRAVRDVLARDLDDLRAKLPPALARSGDLDLDSDEWLGDRVVDAQALLRARLIEVRS